MKPNESEIKYLNRLINRYFDATASEAEERELRRMLASTRLRSPEIEQARAVMGFYAVGRKAAPAGRQWRLPAAVTAAAAAAVVAVCVGANALFGPSAAHANQCVAFGGQPSITDSRSVLAMMHSE
ncbi:MAG: hypothetical protein K2N10_02685, partial [Muribaculaceae bacterium]|nr:hypothetical protein [Muribaculaceae bacterium]